MKWIYAAIFGITLAAGLALLATGPATAGVAVPTGVQVHAIEMRLPGKMKSGTIYVTAGTLLSGSGEVQPIDYRDGEDDGMLAANVGGGNGGVFTVVLDSSHGVITTRRAHGTFLLGGKTGNGCQLEGAGTWLADGSTVTASGQLALLCSQVSQSL